MAVLGFIVFNLYTCNIQVELNKVTRDTWTFQSFFQYDEVAQLLFQLITKETKNMDGEIRLIR